MTEENENYNAGSASSEELIEALKDGFQETINRVLSGVKGDIKEYAAELAKEYGRYLVRAVKGDDAAAERNLTHLKAQIAIIAITRRIIILDDILVKLNELAEIAVRIGIKVLLTAL